MIYRLRLLLTLVLALIINTVSAQNSTIFSGVVKDEEGLPIPGVSIVINSGELGGITDVNGNFHITLSRNSSYSVVIGHTGFQKQSFAINTKDLAEVVRNITLKSNVAREVVIEATQNSTFQRLDPKKAVFVPTTTGDFLNQLLSTQMGVSMRNELSSSYSVRGGSYDENLIYVNDIEIYRPFLVRAGQQEGLSFINGDMVEKVSFSAGGFEAKFGDKMASVLDVQYRKPTQFAGSAQASLLGGSFHLENISKNQKTTYTAGIRYKNNAYVLGSLDTKGEYKPSYTDFQTYLTHRFNDKWSLGFLGNYSSNRFNYVPQTRETELGSIQQALRFTVYFDGQELSKYHTGLGAVDLNYQYSDKVRFKLIASQFYTSEREEFDIVAQYSLDEIERDFGSDNFGNVVRNLGVGGYLNHARNKLTADVKSLNFKGYAKILNKYLQFGAGLQNERIQDQLSEYVYVDSADYSLPQKNNGTLEVSELIRSKNEINSFRLNAYVQNMWSWLNDSRDQYDLNIGVRANYWTYSDQLLFSPRASFSFTPDWTRKINDSTVVKKNLILRFSTGYYYQPPFYREMRDHFGNLNSNIKAQKSIHFVFGVDYGLRLWNRPFILKNETWYKQYYSLIPYELENTRLRYYAKNDSKGYATGIDFKLNGEFVPGIESSASLSFLQTREDLIDDYYYNYFNKSGQQIYSYTFDQEAVKYEKVTPGYIPRPTDQLVSFGMFFQDEMKRFKGFKVNLNFLYGTGLPYGPPSYDRFKDTLRTPSYKRVDIGFMKDLVTAKKPGKGMFKHLKEAYVTVEVFNILAINNTINHQWIRDVNGTQYSVPNYLTGRRVNVRLIVRF